MLLEYTDTAAGRLATTITRRTMLRRAGAAALGAGLWGLSSATPLAEAHGSPSHPCGPSPYCLSGRCFDGQCSNAAGRHYSTYSCWPNHLGGCWNEDYRSTGQGLWSCCDCCSFDHLSGANQCSSCGDSNTRWACICHKQIG
jgi:hypothetical protein